MKNHIKIGMIISTFAMVTACGSDPEGITGPQGANGGAGANGANGEPGADGSNGNPGTDFPITVFKGSVDNAGMAGSGFLVSMTSVAPDGNRGAVYSASLTDEAGNFSFNQTAFNEPMSAMRYEAYGPGRVYTALVASLEQSIGPATSAVEQIISQIVGSTGAPFYADYTADEINSAVTDAETALDPSTINLLDDEAVYSAVLANVGEAIADLSGVDPVVQVAAVPAVAIPDDVQVPFNETKDDVVTLTNELEWDITPFGYMSSGAFSNSGFRLKIVDGASFDWSRKLGNEISIEDDREVVLVASFNNTPGLAVTRKIYIPTTGNWGRWIETFENTSEEAISLNIMVESDLDSGDEITGPTSSGDNVMDSEDRWVTIDDDENNQDGRESVGWYFPGADKAELNGDDLEFTFALNLEAGQRVSVVHWQFRGPSLADLSNCDDGVDNDGNGDEDSVDPDCLVDSSLPFDAESNPVDNNANEAGLSSTTSQDLALVMSGMELQGIPLEYLEGMSEQEITESNFQFIDNRNNVFGGAGSVAPGAQVTIMHSSNGYTATTMAATDGSFQATIPTQSGDELQLTTDLGRDDTLTTP
ncbi:MAG: hypothetical protein HOK97_17625 [Deltaproteobacteria bacterium]|nr:hypothetical protein [Deltaproteobacteria bacterium]